MAITTDNEKLALLEEGTVWEPGLPMSPGTLGDDDKQQLLWGYPGILWSEIRDVFGVVMVNVVMKRSSLQNVVMKISKLINVKAS